MIRVLFKDRPLRRKWRARQKRRLLLQPLLPYRHQLLDFKPSTHQSAATDPARETPPKYSTYSRLRYHHSNMVFKRNLSRPADLTRQLCTIITALL